MTDNRWDKYAILKCPGCGSPVADNRADNVVRFGCGSEEWAPMDACIKGRFRPSLACLEARVEALERYVAELKANAG